MAYLDEQGVTTLSNLLKAHYLLELFYPVGSVYISVNNTNPSTLFGGTWVQIEDVFLLSAGSTYTAGVTGGQAEYDADDMPAHTHTRGTMEIEGIVGPLDDSSNNVLTGAFYNMGSYAYDASSSGSGSGWKLGFKASNGWTGETSQSGTNENATIMPPYLVVYMWKRTA